MCWIVRPARCSRRGRSRSKSTRPTSNSTAIFASNRPKRKNCALHRSDKKHLQAWPRRDYILFRDKRGKYPVTRRPPLFALAISLVSGCPCDQIKKANSNFDNAIDSVNDAITALTDQSDLWRAEIDHLADQLLNAGMTKAAAYVRNTISDGIAIVGIQYQCEVDYTARRIKDALVDVRQAIVAAHGDATPAQTQRPAFVCSITPREIAWQEAPSSLVFHGFDFQPANVSATIEESAGAETDVSTALTWNTAYEVTLNLSDSGARFPRSCVRLKLYSGGHMVSAVACTTSCPEAPPPTIIPAHRQMAQITTNDKCDGPGRGSMGCKFDDNYTRPCTDGYFREEPIEVHVTGGRGRRHCGDSADQRPSSSGTNTRWLSDNPTDCSFHGHAGVTAGYRHYVTCQWIVWEQRPEQKIEHPRPVVGWCK